MIERIHLTILLEVERRGSLTAAARALNVTQSALSHTIRKLEADMGAPVWHREGRTLRPTPVGLELIAAAQRLLPQFDHLEQRLHQIAHGKRGSLRIGMECHPCYEWLLRLISPYLQAYPDVDLDVRQRFQFGGVGALFNHEIDVLVTPDPIRRKRLVFEPVFGYEHVLVVGRTHRLASKQVVVPADLRRETLLTYPVELERLDIYSQFLLPANCSPRSRKVIETTDIILKLVEGGRGVTALPRWFVEDYERKLELQTVRLGEQGLHKRLYLGTRRADSTLDFIVGFKQLALERSPVTAAEHG